MSDVIGDKAVIAAFGKLGKAVIRPVGEAQRHALRPVVKTAKSLVVNDPELKKSLTVKKSPRSPKFAPTYLVGPDSKSPAVRRAHFKELGTEPHMIGDYLHPGEPPRPFLTPAYFQHDKEVVARFGEKLGPAVEKQAARLARKAGK